MTTRLLALVVALAGVLRAEPAAPGAAPGAAPAPAPLKALFLGDQGVHKPAERFADAAPAMPALGIEWVYTENLGDLNPETLAKYPVLILYANHKKLPAEAEQALLGWIENGGGLVAIHSATNCFTNSPKFIALVGARFKSHGSGVMTETIAAQDHPLMLGYKPIESWDETRVHNEHNEENRTVLTYHNEDKRAPEPWTWVRTQGKGRVFYTAWGHDERTWRQPGFHDLLARAIRWTAGQSPTQPK